MTQKKNTLVKIKKDITQAVLDQVAAFEKTGELNFPATYSPNNAIKCAFLVISDTKNKKGETALEFCTKNSISSALLKMVTEGLTPVKDQCYFIMYGNELNYQRSYQGDITIGKRDAEMKTVTGAAIFKNDEFAHSVNVETGIKKISKHEQSLSNFGKDISGAYAIITFNDGSKHVEIMDFGMIKQAWEQGFGLGPAHKNFPDQMAIKTVIHRACKLFINTTDDSGLMTDKAKADSLHTIKENANTEELEFEDVEVIESKNHILNEEGYNKMEKLFDQDESKKKEISNLKGAAHFAPLSEEQIKKDEPDF